MFFYEAVDEIKIFPPPVRLARTHSLNICPHVGA
jgi:hypothetical protein